jgi:hypothetical protein
MADQTADQMADQMADQKKQAPFARIVHGIIFVVYNINDLFELTSVSHGSCLV